MRLIGKEIKDTQHRTYFYDYRTGETKEETLPDYHNCEIYIVECEYVVDDFCDSIFTLRYKREFKNGRLWWYWKHPIGGGWYVCESKKYKEGRLKVPHYVLTYDEAEAQFQLAIREIKLNRLC